MSIAHLVTVDEYLHSTFEHDAEYVEGRIVYRPLPQKPHSKMQVLLVRILYEIAHPLGFEVWTEQRIRTSPQPARYRIPDVCLTFGEPDEDVFTGPPFLCIEILSPDESDTELRMKIEEYLKLGVPYVWVIDPVSLAGEIHTRDHSGKALDGRYRAGTIELDLNTFYR